MAVTEISVTQMPYRTGDGKGGISDAPINSGIGNIIPLNPLLTAVRKRALVDAD